MNGRKSWNHDSAENRKNIGLPMEEQFAEEFRCGCGGEYRRSNVYAFDLICKKCGKSVDVKFSLQTERTGNIAIAENAWGHYKRNTMIVTYVTGTWFGATKEYIENHCDCIYDALPSTHAESGGYNGNAYRSDYYLIPVNSLLVL